ncbi:hypothetical protein ABIF83_003775 [Bradyrhizobium ottawaense]
MKPGVAAQTTGTLPMPSSSPLTSSTMAGSVALPGRNLDQRDQVGRIEPMHVEEAARIHDRAGEIIDEDGRRRRCHDRVGSDLP